MWQINSWTIHENTDKYEFRLMALGDLRFLEVEKTWYPGAGYERSVARSVCLVELGASRVKADWHHDRPAVEGESGLWLPAVNPGDSIIVDTPGAAEVKAVRAGDRVYREIEKKRVSVLEKKCTCPIFDLIAGGCKCGGFKAERESVREAV